MTSELDRLKSVLVLDTTLNKIQDEDVLLETILTETRTLLSADAGTIYKKEGNELEFTYSQNDTKAAELKPGEKLIYTYFRIPIGKGTISGFAAMAGNLVNVRNVYRIPEDAPYGFNPSYDRKSGYRTVSTLAIPLKTNTQEILGVLQLINKKSKSGRTIAFSRDDELIAEHFASNATNSLQRTQMIRRILNRMTDMAKLRDPKETTYHVNRVAGYSAEIYERWALKAGRPRREIDRMRDVFSLVARLHDVGKVAISDAILKKAGPLTPEEREVMKTHAWCGARLFADSREEFDVAARHVALDHHENWDGTGYPGHIDLLTGKPLKRDKHGRPRGKRHEEISIYGRIVALADVYDALRSVRAYKKAWTEDQTLEEMRSLSGTKFDPELVDIFLDAVPSIKTTSDRYAEQEMHGEPGGS